MAFTCEILSLLAGGLLLWEVYGRVRLSEKVVKDGDKSVSTPREERQCNYSRPRSSDDLLVSWSGRGMQGVLLFMTAYTVQCKLPLVSSWYPFYRFRVYVKSRNFTS